MKCPSGKRAFRDRIAAQWALARYQRYDDPRKSWSIRRAYKCLDCYKWHLTSQK